jgi:hypothetical protein
VRLERLLITGVWGFGIASGGNTSAERVVIRGVAGVFVRSASYPSPSPST